MIDINPFHLAWNSLWAFLHDALSLTKEDRDGFDMTSMELELVALRSIKSDSEG